MTKQDLDRGIVLHAEIKKLKYILKSMEQQSDLCIHLHKNLGEDISIKDENLAHRILGLIEEQKMELAEEFQEL